MHPAVESIPGGGLPLSWKRVTTVLELIQQTSDVVRDVQMLPPHLFNLLSRYKYSLTVIVVLWWLYSSLLPRCLEVEEYLRLQLEYTQQLLLSSLLHICSYLTDQGLEIARGLQFRVVAIIGFEIESLLMQMCLLRASSMWSLWYSAFVFPRIHRLVTTPFCC